jgi:phosphate butyryltransferase
MIKTLDQMVEKVRSLEKRHRIAVAWAQDSNTIGAIAKAVDDGFADAFMIGKSKEITRL